MTARIQQGAATGLVAAGLLALCAYAPTAQAATPESDRLCGHDEVRCSIQAPATWTAGATHQVGVTGRPGATLTLQGYRVTVASQGQVTWEAVGPEITVTTDDRGWAGADVTLPPLGTGEHGGPVVVAPTEAEGEPLNTVLGAWTDLVSTVPEVLGDGFAQSKPVGTPLALVLDHVRPGTEYVVERQDPSGWVAVPSGDGPGAPEARTTCTTTRCTVSYVVPRGLGTGVHDFRLVDARSGVPAVNWDVSPDPRGRSQSRPQSDLFPVLGADVAGSVAASTGQDGGAVARPRSRNLDVPRPSGTAAAEAVGPHSVRTVQVAAAVAGGAAVLLTLLPSRRRSRR